MISPSRLRQSVTSRSILVVATLLLAGLGADAQTIEWPGLDSLDREFALLDSLSEHYHNVLVTDSSDIEAWEGLCALAKRRGLFEIELTLAQRSVELLPSESRALTLLGDAYLDNGYLPEAIEALHSALHLDPGGVRILTMLAESYDLVDLTDSVLFYIDSALVLNPRNVQAHFQRADHLYRSGRRLEAIESFESWALLQPFKPEPWIRLGGAQVTVGLYDRALETLSYAIELAPDSPDAHFDRAVALKRTGRDEEARDAFISFLFTFPRDERAFEAEEMARSLGWAPGGR